MSTFAELQVDIQKVWLLFSSVVLAFAFIFGNSIRQLYEAVIFLFVIHPYDVGDWLTIDTAQYQARTKSLLPVPIGLCVTFLISKRCSKSERDILVSLSARKLHQPAQEAHLLAEPQCLTLDAVLCFNSYMCGLSCYLWEACCLCSAACNPKALEWCEWNTGITYFISCRLRRSAWLSPH